MVSKEWQAQNEWLDKQEDGDFFLFVRRFDRAQEAFQSAIQKGESFGPFDARLARSLTGLARVFMAKHDFESARLQYERALEIKRKSYGNENSDVIDIIRELACAQVQLGHTQEARKLIDEALQLQVKTNDLLSMPEAKFIASKICLQENNAKDEEKNLAEAADGFLKDVSLTYPVNTMRLQNSADCVYSYCSFLDRHGKQVQADNYRAKITPVQNWLNMLGQTGV